MAAKIITECKFHSVAQGLFYSGVIHANEKRFSFVYDCGTDMPYNAGSTSRLNKSIDEFKRNVGSSLDLLFISHFHYDHISGIPTLLNELRVDTVVMPYTTIEDRVLYLSSFEGEYSEEMRGLITNPVNFFTTHGAANIIHMGTPEGEPDEGELNNNLVWHPESPDFRLFSPSEERPRGRTVDNPNGRFGRSFCYYYSNAISLSVRRTWEFCVFSDPTPVNLLDNLRADINGVANGNVRDYMENCTLASLRNIKDIYIRHSGQSKLNQHSIMVISRPIKTESPPRMITRLPYNHNRKLSTDSCTSVLLGDIPFEYSTKAVPFLRDNIEDDEALIVLLPHHGSREGVSASAMTVLGNAFLFVASFGEARKRSRLHPHMDYLRSCINRAFFFIPVSERNDFCYTIYQDEMGR